jgi:hypothetical protein
VSAIVIQPHIDGRHDLNPDPADYMPLSVRMHVARELNRLWAEFVNEMHDGPTPGTAQKFWKYVLAGG